jgi:DNA-binding MarR family transcriptional regulator
MYDHQFSILAQLATRGPASINELAKNLIMDRTTLSRNLKPLQQAGWITQTPDETDRRSHCLRLSAAGHQHCQLALPAWLAAQTQFEQTFGDAPAASLRQVLQTITQLPLLE